MTEEEKEVAQQLAAHPNFRPRVGMKFLTRASGYPLICTSWTKDTHTGDCAVSQEGERYPLGEGCYPDISHPATKGCLLALARERWGDLYADLYYYPGGEVLHPDRAPTVAEWRWDVLCAPDEIDSATEGLTLARAIMEAPSK